MDIATRIYRYLLDVPQNKTEELKMSVENKKKPAPVLEFGRTIINMKNETIEVFRQELECTETRLRQTEKDLMQAKKMNGIHGDALDELRIVALDALSPIEEAINALAGYGIEIPGLSAAHADLRSAAE